jgi:hypothetical protein
MNQTLKKLTPLLVVFTVLLSSNFINAAWSNPTATPPGDNPLAPINESLDNQLKQGDITARNLKAGLKMWSPEYCDEAGENCFSAASTTSGGSPYTVCTNENSDGDGTDDIAACVAATTDNGVGTSQYRAAWCDFNITTNPVQGSAQNRWTGTVWQYYSDSWNTCADGTINVINLESGGGTTGSENGFDDSDWMLMPYSPGVWYTNDTGKSISVQITVVGRTGDTDSTTYEVTSSAYLRKNGTAPGLLVSQFRSDKNNKNSGTPSGTHSFIVPPGYQYIIVYNQKSQETLNWLELR